MATKARTAKASAQRLDFRGPDSRGLDSRGLGPTRPRRAVATDVVRALAAAGVLLSADVHLNLWLEGYRDIATIGPLFLLNAAGGVVVAVALLAWPHPLAALAAAGSGAATLAAFWLSATVGLFGLHESAGGTPQLVAEGAEIAALVCGGAAAWLTWPPGRRRA